LVGLLTAEYYNEAMSSTLLIALPGMCGAVLAISVLNADPLVPSDPGILIRRGRNSGIAQ